MILKAATYRQGLWRNGLGVSWNIAEEGGEPLDWRMALARLDADAPFSDYPGVDRVFTIIEGKGVELKVGGIGTIEALRHRPVIFPGDRPTFCRVAAGPCRALNLFVKRGGFVPDVVVTCHGKGDELALAGMNLLFIIDGQAALDGEDLEREDTGIVKSPAAMRFFADTVLWRTALQAANSH
jgi:environmental stress-induced protein Ves